MTTLVLNSGSSSIKFSVFESAAGEPRCVLDGEISGLGSEDAELQIAGKKSCVDAGTPEKALDAVLAAVGERPLQAVGYRVVHPGPKLKRHLRIDDEVLKDLEEAAKFAPLHDPAVLVIIRAMQKRLRAAEHYACFDTVFHQTMPAEATTYPLPLAVRARGVKRYGFHGLSCESIVRRLRLVAGEFPARAVIAHLGSGCSVTALRDGHSVDTTMGLTPDGGVVMGTRPGDLDPGLLLYLVRQDGGAEAVETMLNKNAGMVALSGMKNDVKAMRQAAAEGNQDAALALSVFARSVRKAIGGYAWLLGGLDAIVFSGGIGEHDPATRSDVLNGLEAIGIKLAEHDHASGPRKISTIEATTEVWVVPAEEDLMIAIHVEEMARE